MSSCASIKVDFDLHLGDSSLRARISTESREGGVRTLAEGRLSDASREIAVQCAHSLFDILVRLAGREVWSVRKVGRHRQNVRAVSKSGWIMAELAHSLEDELEAVLQLGLVGCELDELTPGSTSTSWTRTAERLPLASSTRITSELLIGE